MNRLSAIAWFAVTVGLAVPALPAGATTIDVASTFPLELPLFSEAVSSLARQIGDLTDGSVNLVFHAPGDLASAADAMEMVSTGKLAAAWSTAGQLSQRDVAFEALSSIPFGPDTNEYLAWLLEGGGLQLSRKLFADYGIYNVPCLIMPPEGAGWFSTEIKTVEDLKGLRIRYFGLGGRVLARLGATLVRLSPDQLVGALQRHEIDAAEYSLPAMDLVLGLNRVARYYYFPGWHQQTTLYELYFALDTWRGLTPKQQRVIETACAVTMRDGIARAANQQTSALRDIKASGIKLRRWSPQLLLAFEASWAEMADELKKTNPRFREILESYQRFRDDYAFWKRISYLP